MSLLDMFVVVISFGLIGGMLGGLIAIFTDKWRICFILTPVLTGLFSYGFVMLVFK